MEKIRIPYEDVIDLAAHICDLEDETPPEEIEDALYDKFNISMDDFHNLCEHLLPLIDFGEFNGEKYKGFGIRKWNYGVWFVKTKIK
jgi:hypothetical protein